VSVTDDDVGWMPSGRVFTSARAAFWSWRFVSEFCTVSRMRKDSVVGDGHGVVLTYTDLRAEGGEIREEFCYSHVCWGFVVVR
jgi:hypothetical protein